MRPRAGRALVYALGGGNGHLRRALTLVERLGVEATVLHQSHASVAPQGVRLQRLPDTATADTVRDWLRHQLPYHDHLFVDTFPQGIAGELDDTLFGQVPTTLIARHLDRERYPEYDEAAARFDRIWLPYDLADDEWDMPPPGEPIGVLVRKVTLAGETDVLVIGDPTSLPESWQALLVGATLVNGPFDTLMRARVTVALGCGYNLGWELASVGVRAAFRPLPRRYDDQFRRALRLGSLLHHREDLTAALSQWSPA